MTPGNPLPPSPSASLPADLSPSSVSRGNLIPELSATLSGCAIITAEDGVIVVEPLQYIGLSDASGRLKADLPRFHHSHGRL